MSATPKWATPERLALLNSINPLTCTCGEDDCKVIAWWSAAMRHRIGEPTPATLPSWLIRAALLTPQVLATVPDYLKLHLPFYLKAELKDWWKADDRGARKYVAAIERRKMHAPDRTGWGRRFDPLRKEQFLTERDEMYIEAVGVSGLTFTRIVKVRVPSSTVRLFVDVAGASTRKSRRKARRNGRPMPPTIEELCRAAVRDYLDKLGKE